MGIVSTLGQRQKSAGRPTPAGADPDRLAAMILAATLAGLVLVILTMTVITIRHDLPLWVYVLMALATYPLAKLLMHDTALGDLGARPVMDWAVSLALIATGNAILSVLLGWYRKRHGARDPRPQQAEDREPDVSA